MPVLRQIDARNMIPRRLFVAAALLPLVGVPLQAAAAPKVVTSIPPVHSLVAGVMEGVGEPTLLVPGGGSPHAYNLRPSQARSLSEADVIFWVAPALEGFMVKPLKALPRDARVVELSELPGLALLPARVGGAWDDHGHDHHDEHGDHGHDDHGDKDHGEHAHDDHGDKDHGHDDHGHEKHAGHDDHADHDDHGHDDHGHGKHAGHDDHADHDDHAEHSAHGDPHIWLDPRNGKLIVRAAVEALTERDPANAARYRENGAAVAARLDALDAELAATLEPVRGLPYVVFHDAYQYFEVRYGMSAVGSITLSPERAPGAKRLQEIREKIVSTRAACVFSEPQFEPSLVETVVSGTGAKTAELDPLGARLQPGPAAYDRLLRNLSKSLITCLKPVS